MLLDVQHLLDFHILGFVKFFDPMEFAAAPTTITLMEREWRMYGNQFEVTDIL